MNPSRREDLRLIKGEGRYTADWNFPGQLHAAVLRSPYAHARINSIDTADALAMPGVKAVLTSADADVAALQSIIGGIASKNAAGETMKKPFYPVLARGEVQYTGQAVAFVVAETAHQAQDAAESIMVDYEELPAASGIDAALAPGAPSLHADIPGNLAYTHTHGDAAATDAAFAKAKFVTRLTVESQRLIGNPMEPRACLVRYDAASGRVTLHSSTQGIGGMRNQLAQITGIAPEMIDIVAEDVGGSFGIRGTPYPEYMCSLICAKRLGVPVKWVGTRGETFLSDYHGRALSLTGEIAMDAEGNFLAMRWDDRVDLGAYPGPWGAFIGTSNLSITCGGVYQVPALSVRTRLVYTSATPVSAYRGAGRPDIAYAIERLVDQAAHEHGFDRIALRRRNMIPPAAMPFKTASGSTYDCGEFAAVMDHALEDADWQGFSSRKADSQARGMLRGLGIATFLEASGGGAAPKDQTAARVQSGVVTIYCVAGGSGQGHETTFVDVFAQECGLDAAQVRYKASDSAMKLVGNGTGGSRTALAQGSSFKLLAQALIAKAAPFAEAKLGGAASFAQGTFSHRDKRVSLSDLLKEHGNALDCEAEGSFGVTFPNGCHIAEVEIDPRTGVSTIARYLAMDDLGNVLQHTIVEGQVHGGVAQGAGQVFGEHAVYDEGGQFLTGSFMDYPMPRAGMLPQHMVSRDHPVPTAANLLGSKGVGESGCSGSLPALMNALMDAVRSEGVQDLQMPVTPARLWQTLRDAQQSKQTAKAA
jgi:aerobic carbon-monoxide dehydrogenase large subunit